MSFEQACDLKKIQTDHNVREEKEKFEIRLEFEKKMHKMRMAELRMEFDPVYRAKKEVGD